MIQFSKHVLNDDFLTGTIANSKATELNMVGPNSTF